MAGRICISGIGVVSPIGIGRENYWNALAQGDDGIAPVNLFDCSPLRCKLGAQVSKFDGAKLVGSKGLKYIDRLSQFAIAASKLALEDAGVCLDQVDPKRRGIVLGTAFGGLASQQEINRERVLEGPKWVSPIKFPNTPINALSYQIPIRYQMRLANVTLSSGMTSGLEAIRYGTLLLNRSSDAVLLCGGADELSFHAYYSSYFMGELAGVDGPETSCPFDQRRNGYIQGEGCALLVLETADTLYRRGGRGLAEIRGYGSSFAPPRADVSVKIDTVASAMRLAIANVGIDASGIGLVVASANSSRETDLVEARAIAKVFGERSLEIPVAATKSTAGEAFGASGTLQVAAAVMVLNNGTLPPAVRFEIPDPECPVRCVRERGRVDEVRYALVNCIDRHGSVASLVLGKMR